MKVKLIKVDKGYYNLEDEKGNILGTSYQFNSSVGDVLEYKLSKQNCDEIFGVVDVDGLARKWRDNSMYRDANAYSYKAGFSKAMELNKDNMFTVEDMRNAMDWIMTQYFEFHEQPTTGRREQYLESLQQPKEIGVEIEMEEEFIFDPSMGISQGNYLKMPKLDSEGCLILKKI
jgi:hypothetical protein